MDLVIVHLRYVWINFNWIMKIALQKRGWTTIAIRIVFVSVYTHINEKNTKDVSTSTGIVNSFSTSLNTGNVISFNLLMLMIDLIPDQTFFHIILITQKVILKIIRFARFKIFDNTIPEFLWRFIKFGFECLFLMIFCRVYLYIVFSNNMFGDPGFSG